MLASVHALTTGCFRVLSKGRPQRRETRKLHLQNITFLEGNIGQKPEVRSSQGKIANVTLATLRPRLSEGSKPAVSVHLV